MQCPRCHGESDPSTSACASCGAPLLLQEEPELAPLDRQLELDRRHLGRLPTPSPSLTDARERREASLIERLETRQGAPESCSYDPDLGQGARAAGPRTRPGPALGPRAPGPSRMVTPVPPAPLPALDDPGLEAVAADGPAAPPAHEASRPGASARQRASAWALDAGLLTVAASPPLLLAACVLPAGVGLGALAPTAVCFAAVLAFAYTALSHALMGATIGKRLLGLRVVGPDGAAPGLGRSAARAALAVLGAVPLGLGVLAALFTGSGRGLHDLAVGTQVVRAP